MKPIIKYRGGKSKEIHLLTPYIPHYAGRYIEPFLGGGAMYFYLEPQHAVINDINTKLMNFYSAVQQNYLELSEELAQLEMVYTANRKVFDAHKKKCPNERIEDKNEALYYELRDMYNSITKPKYSEAALYYFINKTAYSGMIRFNSKGEYNVPYGRYKNFNTALITEQHHQLLLNTEIHNTDYRVIFSLAEPDDFVFLDPPTTAYFLTMGMMNTGMVSVRIVIVNLQMISII